MKTKLYEALTYGVSGKVVASVVCAVLAFCGSAIVMSTIAIIGVPIWGWAIGGFCCGVWAMEMIDFHRRLLFSIETKEFFADLGDWDEAVDSNH